MDKHPQPKLQSLMTTERSSSQRITKDRFGRQFITLQQNDNKQNGELNFPIEQRDFSLKSEQVRLTHSQSAPNIKEQPMFPMQTQSMRGSFVPLPQYPFGQPISQSPFNITQQSGGLRENTYYMVINGQLMPIQIQPNQYMVMQQQPYFYPQQQFGLAQQQFQQLGMTLQPQQPFQFHPIQMHATQSLQPQQFLPQPQPFYPNQTQNPQPRSKSVMATQTQVGQLKQSQKGQKEYQTPAADKVQPSPPARESMAMSTQTLQVPPQQPRVVQSSVKQTPTQEFTSAKFYDNDFSNRYTVSSEQRPKVTLIKKKGKKQQEYPQSASKAYTSDKDETTLRLKVPHKNAQLQVAQNLKESAKKSIQYEKSISIFEAQIEEDSKQSIKQNELNDQGPTLGRENIRNQITERRMIHRRNTSSQERKTEQFALDLKLAHLRSTPENLKSEQQPFTSPSRSNKSAFDDDIRISDQRSALLNKTARSQKEELLSKRSGSVEKDKNQKPYVDIVRRQQSMQRLIEEKDRLYSSSITFAAQKRISTGESHNNEMSQIIGQKLADQEDTISLNRSINKFLIDSIQGKNEVHAEQLGISLDSSINSEQGQVQEITASWNAGSSAYESTSKIRISDQQPSKVNESSRSQVNSSRQSLFQSQLNPSAKDIHIGGVPWEHLKIQMDDPDFELTQFKRTLSKSERRRLEQLMKAREAGQETIRRKNGQFALSGGQFNAKSSLNHEIERKGNDYKKQRLSIQQPVSIPLKNFKPAKVGKRLSSQTVSPRNDLMKVRPKSGSEDFKFNVEDIESPKSLPANEFGYESKVDNGDGSHQASNLIGSNAEQSSAGFYSVSQSDKAFIDVQGLKAPKAKPQIEPQKQQSANDTCHKEQEEERTGNEDDSESSESEMDSGQYEAAELARLKLKLDHQIVRQSSKKVPEQYQHLFKNEPSRQGTFTSKNTINSDSSAEQRINGVRSRTGTGKEGRASDDSLNTDDELQTNHNKPPHRKQSVSQQRYEKSREELFELSNKRAITIRRLSSDESVSKRDPNSNTSQSLRSQTTGGASPQRKSEEKTHQRRKSSKSYPSKKHRIALEAIKKEIEEENGPEIAPYQHEKKSKSKVYEKVNQIVKQPSQNQLQRPSFRIQLQSVKEVSERSSSDGKSLQSFVASEVSSRSMNTERTAKTTPIIVSSGQNLESLKQQSSLQIYQELQHMRASKESHNKRATITPNNKVRISETKESSSSPITRKSVYKSQHSENYDRQGSGMHSADGDEWEVVSPTVSPNGSNNRVVLKKLFRSGKSITSLEEFKQ